MSKTSGRRVWIFAPALVPPALVALAFVFGVPQQLVRTLEGADPLEPNDTFAESLRLPAGTTTGIRCGPGDVDWFAVEIPPGKCLQLTTSPPSTGDGATSIHDADGVLLAQTRFGDERCVYAPKALSGESVHVRVWGERSIPYTLKVEFADPGQRFEPNDLPANATPVELGRHDRVTCSGSDWFRVNQPKGRRLLASVASSTGVGVRLLSTTSTVAPVTTGLPPSASAAGVGAQRALLVHVFGRGTYALDLSAGPASATEVRHELEALRTFNGSFEPNDRREDAQPIGAGSYPRLRCNSKDWYSLAVPKDSSLRVTMTFERGRGDLQAKLESLTFPLGSSSSRYGNYTSNGYELRHFTETDEQLLLLISGSRIPYKLAVEITPGLPGVPLAAGEYSDITCAGTDLWRVQLQKGDRLEVELTNDVSDGWLDMTLYDKTWSSRGSSSSGSGLVSRVYKAREAGPAFLQVSGATVAYRLSVTIDGAAEQAAFTPPSSVRIGPGVYPKRILNKEIFYAIPIARAGGIMIETSFDNAAADLDLELLDASGNQLIASATTDDVEHVEYLIAKPQTVYARIYTYAEEPAAYELTIAVNDRTRPLIGSVPELGPGKRSVDAPTENEVFAVRVERNQRLSASITHDTGGELSLALHDGRGREIVVSSGGRPGSKNVEYTSPRTQTLYLRAHGPKPVAFEIDVAVAAPSE